MRKKKPDSATARALLQSNNNLTSNDPLFFNESGAPPAFARHFHGSPRRSTGVSKQPDALRPQGRESPSPVPLE